MAPLWALLVSIENYHNPDWPVVSGAHLDASNTISYLTNDLQVPRNHIVHLKDAKAKRSNIISSFKRHLVENPDITHGDAILFHYSGHGSFLKAPSGWTVIEEKTGDETQDDMVEVIVPWDDGIVDDETSLPACGIPDRTLAALINKAAAAHGNNITVVLDCCCSGHGTRGGNNSDHDDEEELVARSVDSELLSPLYADLDEDLVPRSIPTKTTTRRERIRALAADHVLMAACGSREQAMGGGRHGGIFTRLWLDSLRRTDIYPRTYSEVLKRIDASINVLRTRLRLNQHPQCDGIVRDRLVFEETMLRADCFDAAPIDGHKRDGDMLEISAGRIHGIEVGTLFELHIMNQQLQPVRTLGTAIARHVNATTSTAALAHGIILTAEKYTAVVAQPAEKLSYVLVNNAPRSIKANEAMNLFQDSISDRTLQDKARIREVTNDRFAALQICFEADGSMTLHRLDPLLASLRNKNPRLTMAEVGQANFDKILNGIARFNRLLMLTSATHPFIDKVQFELHRLLKGEDSDITDEGFVIREASMPIKFVGDEVVVEQGLEGEEEDYAIVLQNKTLKMLHVYVWYFDPSTYQISLCYQSANPDKATLAANGGKLQIGASTERADTLQFYVPDGANSDTIFAKVFMTDRPTNVDFLSQDPLIGQDEEGKSVILECASNRVGEGETAAKGQWDTILRKITVVESAKS